MLFLRKVKKSDYIFFTKWWCDKELIALTSGDFSQLSNKETESYFYKILNNKNSFNFMIVKDKKTIGNVSLSKRRNNWFETQIVIGYKQYWGKGYGSQSIELLKKKAKQMGISKIYLEVRPKNARAILAYERCGFRKVKMVNYSKNKYLRKTLRMELL